MEEEYTAYKAEEEDKFTFKNFVLAYFVAVGVVAHIVAFLGIGALFYFM